MKAESPLVLDIKGNSLDDGPGIRTVVFLKGCPLACQWCHNPESQKPGHELGFDPKQCVGCDTCLDVCPKGALSRENPGFIDRQQCDLCFACADACPSGALERVGRKMSVDEVVAEVVKDKPFFDASGGGATLSGGEPTLSMEFCASLLAALKQRGVHTLIETCGMFDYRVFEDLLLPHLDAVYFDLKIIDEAAHKKFTGASNKVIIENFRRLSAATKKTGTDLLPRVPLAPGMTATAKNVTAVAELVKDCGGTALKLLAYNPLWHEKTDKIGRENPHAGSKVMTSWMPQEDIRALGAICHDMGLTT